MDLCALLTTIPILALVSLAFIPPTVANANAGVLRRGVTTVIGIETLLALLLLIEWVWMGRTPLSLNLSDSAAGFFSLYIDGASILMLGLVSFVGFSVSRFSIRYLDGEAMQGRYFCWLGFAVGAVSLMVVAGNLLLFFLAWVMTSFALHQLLLHYRHRDAAHRAAWTKFVISRLGDAFLIAALVVTWKTFGTFELASLLDSATQLGGTSDVGTAHLAVGWLIVLGAVTKSAQFPFHTWLPDTMETPTPVSALMHAGIVNAGGYLIIRMSPLVSLAPAAMVTLAVIGAFTACFAGVVMMTQPSIKRSLAYSTIAQMGFMMLQCGIGAFAAAMLHILAHSLYKAHAFLSSGSVVANTASLSEVPSPKPSAQKSFASTLVAGAASLFAILITARLLGLDLAAKPGGYLLAFVLFVAMTSWGWRLLSFGNQKAALVGAIGVLLLSSSYVAGYLVVAWLLGPMIPTIMLSPSMQFVLFDIALAFCLLFGLHLVIVQRLKPSWLEAFRVHASNGFYLDVIYQRVFGPIAKS